MLCIVRVLKLFEGRDYRLFIFFYKDIEPPFKFRMTPYENISLILSFEVPEDFISKIQETTFTKININISKLIKSLKYSSALHKTFLETKN